VVLESWVIEIRENQTCIICKKSWLRVLLNNFW